MKALSRVLLVVMLFTMLGPVAFAVEEMPNVEAVAGEKAAMDPAMMKKIKTLMVPSEAHKVLEGFAGNWTYTSKFWMVPDGPTEESIGTATHTVVYGGRFLKQEIKGNWMNEPFEGIGYTGYDNIKQEYVSTWIDSMATGIMMVSGQYDAATKTLKQSGENSCPLTGEKSRHGRSEWTVTDNDHNTYTTYLTGPDGNEFKAMEIVYTRTA
ncbi:MAG: DUF1579 domain-containing protein [Candidatus Omnitrophica bacterium]|nr:DUF1579 domain-containing protein [Candidatus Omnitrophota bacterium]